MSTPPGDVDELFHLAPCGYVVTDEDDLVTAANAEFARLIGSASPGAVIGTRLSRHLSVGGRVLLETHVHPLLVTGVAVREVAVDLLCAGGEPVPVLMYVDAVEGGGARTIFVEARHRRQFEVDLLESTRTAERARADAAELSRTLQTTLIPPSPPDIPGLEVAAAYRPAGAGDEVGGDFYDLFRTDATSWVVLLGDVSGKGVPAAIVTSFVRYTVRMLAMEHHDPADLLRHLDAALTAHPTDRYCTLVLARLERRPDVAGGADAGWDVRLGLAGHPLPLLRRPDGTVEQVGQSGSAVGLVDDAAFHTVRFELTDQTLTFFTDGVTEARRAGEMYGDERLEGLIATLPHDARAITDAITSTALDFQDQRASDDIAVVTLSAY